MRCMLKVNIPVEAGNAAAKDGTLGEKMQAILAEIKPEAAYFTDDRGQRTAYLFFDLQEAAQIPAICEPWFLTFNAATELHPAMVLEDLEKAGPAIMRAVSNYC
jgi:hypothetical protein